MFSLGLKTGVETVSYSFCSQAGCAAGETSEAGLVNFNLRRAAERRHLFVQDVYWKPGEEYHKAARWKALTQRPALRL